MIELHRAALAIGAAASLMAATSVYALDAANPVKPADGASTEMQQAVALVSGGVAAKSAADPTCPTVTLAPDADTRRLDGAKATLDGLARDCANLGAETICKIALVGEGARKKAKGAAAFEAPVTIQIKDAEGRDVETRRVNLKVEMPEGVQTVAFNHVEENVSLPPAAAGGYANWTIVVGLDQTGAEPETVASVDENVETAKPARSVKAKRGRYTRSRAVRRANRVARQQVQVPPPVVVSAKPQGAPPAIVTTTTSGSAMARAAATFTENRDRALQEQRARQAQAAQAAARNARQGPPAARAAQQQRPAPQPQAAVPTQRPIRTAQTQTD